MFAGFQNLGYGYDRIENALWRIYHDELDGYEAKKVVLMIGTNNMGSSTDEFYGCCLSLCTQVGGVYVINPGIRRVIELVVCQVVEVFHSWMHVYISWIACLT